MFEVDVKNMIREEGEEEEEGTSSGLVVFKDGLKKCYSFLKSSHFDGQKLPESCDGIFWTPKAPFFHKG